MKPLPCIGCLLVPVCKHKSYYDLFEGCDILKEYEPQYRGMNNFISRRPTVRALLDLFQPTTWTYDDRMDNIIRL